MLNARASAALIAAILLALPSAAQTHERDANQAEERLVDKFTRFAGSRDNAEALVEGLRNDSRVTLERRHGGEPVSFTPKTDKMGYGNVSIALSLAQTTLAEQGIHRPTPEQIKAALNGGTITTKSGDQVRLEGILAQRASGMGWGQVAQANGFKLGEVIGHKHDRQDHKHVDSKRDQADRKHEQGDLQRARFDRPERSHKFDRPERPERPERPHRR